MIIVIEDEFNFTIKFQKSTVTKPVTTNGKKDCTIIDAMELDNTGNLVDKVNMLNDS